MRSVRATIVAVEQQYGFHIVCVFVCVVLVAQHAMRTRHVVYCDLPCSTTFCHIISQTAQVSKKKTFLNTKCVF